MSLKFQIKGGFSKVSKTFSNQVKKKGQFPWTSYCDLVVNYPTGQLNSVSHPILVNRLIRDWGNTLSSLDCSTDDFRAALETGTVSCGHIFAEVYCLCLEELACRLNYDHIHFHEKFKLIEMNGSHVVYRIRLFFSSMFPLGIAEGLEHFTIGYLNAALEDKTFSITERLDEKVRYLREMGLQKKKRRHKKRRRKTPQESVA